MGTFLFCIDRDRSDSQELLEHIEQANLFIIPPDQSHTWYRYHRLFSELLRHRQHITDRQQAAALHQKASQWFEAQGYLPEAIQHALEAQDWMGALRMIGAVSERMFKNGEIVTLMGWLEKIPREIILSQVNLCMIYAWALLLAGKYDLAKSVLDQAERLAPPGSVLLGQAATAQAYLARSMGDNPSVIQYSQLALSLLPQGELVARSNLQMNLGLVYWHEGNLADAEPVLAEAQENAQRSGNLYAQLTAEVFLARCWASRGALHKAAELYSSALQRGGHIPILSLAYFDLGFIHYEWDELEKAETYLQNGLALSQSTFNVEFQIAGLILQVYLHLAKRDLQAASSVVEQACALSKGFSPLVRARSVACQALVALAAGDLQTAAQSCQQAGELVDAHPLYRFLGLVWPRLLLAQGDQAAAARELESRYNTASQNGWGWGLVALRVLQSLAARKRESALDYLADALRLAQPEGFIRTFSEAGEPLVPLLREVASRGISPEYIHRILSTFPGPQKTLLQPVSPLIEPLSARELEVLHLLSGGLSNREIAARLVVSPGTVKTHVHNICGKLGVRNRTQAVMRAKELKLI